MVITSPSIFYEGCLAKKKMKFTKFLTTSMALAAVIVPNVEATEVSPTTSNETEITNTLGEKTELSSGSVFIDYEDGKFFSSSTIHDSKITFNDIQDHWGKEIIEQMVNFGFFKGKTATRFAPEQNMTKAEFITVFARLISPEATFTIEEGDSWYSPYYREVEKKGLITGDFALANMQDDVANIEALFAIKVMLVSGMGLTGDELYLQAHAITFPELTKHYEHALSNQYDYSLTRMDCAALIFDLITENHTIEYGLGIFDYTPDGSIVPSTSLDKQENTEEVQEDEDSEIFWDYDNEYLDEALDSEEVPPKTTGRDDPVTLFPSVPEPEKVELPTWSYDEFGTLSENLLASIVTEFDFGMVAALDDHMISTLVPSIYEDSDEIGLISSYGYQPIISASGLELLVFELKNSADIDKVISALEERIKTQIEGGAWYPSTIEQWEENARITVSDNCVILVVHPESEVILEHFYNFFRG